MKKIFDLVVMTDDEWSDIRKEKSALEDKVSEVKNKIDHMREECAQLADELSAKVTECKVGIWCKDCAHCGRWYD